jgi:DNA invertase Pin-like site-specific DNA recombinase
MDNIIKAVIYARVSSEEQKKEGFSIPAQLDLLHAYAAEHHIEVVKEFVEAETAKQAGRYQFNEMLKFLKKNKGVTSILCEKTDRLYRNFTDYVLLDENKTGYSVYFVKEGNILSPTSSSYEKFVHGLKVLLAKNFIDNLREETQKGRLKKVQEGYYIGQVPYGYKKINKNTTVINEEEAPFVRRAFELYAGGMSLEAVRWKLKEEGFIYKSSNKVISRGQLGKMLHNLGYIGIINFNENNYTGKHEPIISNALFEMAQKSAKKDNKPLTRNKRSHAFLGLIKCGKCGCTVTIEPPKRNGVIYYHCTGSKGECDQKRKNVREEVIMPQLDNAVRAVSLVQKHIDYIKKGLRESLKDKQEFTEELRTNLQAEEDKIRRRIDKITDEYYEDKVSADFYNEKRIKWTHDLEEIMIKLEALHNTEKKLYEEGVRIIETLKNAYWLYQRQNNSEKREMLNYLLSNVTLDGEKVSYNYNLPFSYFINFDSCRKKYPGCDSNA